MHSTAVAAPTSLSKSDLRRTTKPIMEKRRRARINNSLNELKNLVLDYTKSKDSARHNKLEKADILEMAVRHVQTLHRQMAAQRALADPQLNDKYRAGFAECANEVGRFLNRTEVDAASKQQLLGHLGGCMNQLPKAPLQTATPTVLTAAQKYFGNANVQLVPTRLASGEIALVLPNSAPLKNEISVNCNTVNVLGSTGILSPAASDGRSSVSPLPLSLTHSHPITPPPVKMEIAVEEPVWRPW